MIGRDHDQGVRALQLTDGGPDRLRQRRGSLHLLLQQMRDALRVGVRGERVTPLVQALVELLEVLDDPVVDHGHPPVAVEVRMRVAFRRRSVRRPARVADRDGRRRGRLADEQRLQLGELPGPLPHRETAVHDRDARGVVPAILQPAQTFHHDRKRLGRSDVADDAAHQTSRLSVRRWSMWSVIRARCGPHRRPLPHGAATLHPSRIRP